MPVAKKTTSTPAAAQAPMPTSYEAAMQELTLITQTLESGQIPLDELLQKYERAAFLLQFCQDKLQAVQQQVKVLEQGALKDWSAP